MATAAKKASTTKKATAKKAPAKKVAAKKAAPVKPEVTVTDSDRAALIWGPRTQPVAKKRHVPGCGHFKGWTGDMAHNNLDAERAGDFVLLTEERARVLADRPCTSCAETVALRRTKGLRIDGKPASDKSRLWGLFPVNAQPTKATAKKATAKKA